MVTRTDVARWKRERDETHGTAAPDAEGVAHRLITMRKAIDQLRSYGPISAALLAEKPAAGLAAERILFFLTDHAYEINCAFADQRIDRAAGSVQDSTQASFARAVDRGLLDEELAVRLHPADGAHHLLLQLQLDSEPAAVEQAVADALAAFDRYVEVVQARLAAIAL